MHPLPVAATVSLSIHSVLCLSFCRCEVELYSVQLIKYIICMRPSGFKAPKSPYYCLRGNGLLNVRWTLFFFFCFAFLNSQVKLSLKYMCAKWTQYSLYKRDWELLYIKHLKRSNTNKNITVYIMSAASYCSTPSIGSPRFSISSILFERIV